MNKMLNSKKKHPLTNSEEQPLPSSEQEQQTAQSTFAVSGFRSPLPPPSLLDQYEQVRPGAIDWILKTSEEETTHRRKLEDKAFDAEIELMRLKSNEIKRGQLFGFCIGIFTIAAGAYTAVAGAQVAGGFIGTGGVVALVSVFLFSKKSK